MDSRCDPRKTADLAAMLDAIKQGDIFQRLQDVADACKVDRVKVQVWAEERGLVIWSNKRAGRLVGTAKARRDDELFMKRIYG